MTSDKVLRWSKVQRAVSLLQKTHSLNSRTPSLRLIVVVAFVVVDVAVAAAVAAAAVAAVALARYP